MKKSDVIKTILAEAMGAPVALVNEMYCDFTKAIPLQEPEAELPPEKAAADLAALRSELPGIRRWLIQGGYMVGNKAGSA